MRPQIGLDTVYGFDIERDGAFLELSRRDEDGVRPIAEVFRSAESGEFSVWAEVEDLRLDVLEDFFRAARERLMDLSGASSRPEGQD